jgi:hypothetical protein
MLNLCIWSDIEKEHAHIEGEAEELPVVFLINRMGYNVYYYMQIYTRLGYYYYFLLLFI